MNFEQADKLLMGRCKNSRNLCRMTKLKRRGENIAVQLYNTDVITFRPNGTTILFAGKFTTHRTKEIINQFSPVKVYQRKFIWYVTNFIRGGHDHLFRDNMEIDANSQVVEHSGI